MYSPSASWKARSPTNGYRLSSSGKPSVIACADVGNSSIADAATIAARNFLTVHLLVGAQFRPHRDATPTIQPNQEDLRTQSCIRAAPRLGPARARCSTGRVRVLAGRCMAAVPDTSG